MKKIFFSFIVFTLMLKAQINWNPTYNLSNTPSATSDYHSVYSELSGRFYVVWGDNGQIKFKRSTDFGSTWFPNITLFASSNVCGWPVVKADFNYVYVVYHQLAGDYEILFQFSSDFGQTWSQVQGISGMDSGSLTPQLAVAGTNVYVVWEQKISSITNIPDIYFIKSTDRGLTWSSTQNISNTSTSHSRWVQLQTATNSIYCAWLESTTYPASDIYFSKSTDGGSTWSSPINITNDARPQNRIFMNKYGNNIIYIASDDIITFNFDEIYLMKSTDAGLSWSTPRNITNNAGNSNTPCLEIFNGNLYFTWADNSHTAPANDNMDVFFKWSSDDGLTWRDSINLSANSESSSRPRTCYSINGPLPSPWIEMTVIWYDYSTGDAEILARRGIHNFIPVELTSFEAKVFSNNVTLNWTTATEVNNKGFEIERKSDSPQSSVSKWEKIGFVEGNGTTTKMHAYSFIDNNIFSGKYLYRLKQIDFDGEFEYSKIIEVEVNAPSEFTLDQNYPNPFNPSTKIRFEIPEADSPLLGGARGGFVTLKVYDILGNEVATLVDEYKPSGRYEVEFHSAVSSLQLASGVYYYQLRASPNGRQAAEFVKTKKMILIR